MQQRLEQAFRNGRAVVVPHHGRTVVQYGCLRDLVARFVARGSPAGLDTSCVADILPPAFALS